MLAEIVDAIGVMYNAVVALFIIRAQAVFHNHQRDSIAIINLVQRKAKSLGIDLPAPVGRFQIRILETCSDVAFSGFRLRIHRDAVGHVIAEGVEIDGSFAKDVRVSFLHLNADALSLPEALCVGGILAAHHDIRAVPVALSHLLLVLDDIVRIAGQRIGQDEADHVAHLVFRVVLMRVLDDLGACHELVMQSLESLLGLVRHLGDRALITPECTCRQDRAHGHGSCVDFIESQPVFDLALISLENHMAVSLEQLDQLAAFPAVVLLNESERQLIVGNGHKRLDAVFFAAVEHSVVEFQPLLVGLLFHARREDARPVDGSTEALESHLREQRNVFLVVVIEIDRFMRGIKRIGQNSSCHPLGHLMASVGAHIGYGRTFAVHIPCAFKLVGSYRAAPQKIISKYCQLKTPFFY